MSIVSIPKDTLITVLEYSTNEAVLALSQTCKTLRTTVEESYQKLLTNTAGQENLPEKMNSWKKTYLVYHSCLKILNTPVREEGELLYSTRLRKLVFVVFEKTYEIGKYFRIPQFPNFFQAAQKAMKLDDFDTLRILMKRYSVDIINTKERETGQTLLHKACIEDSSDWVKFLVENKAEMDVEDKRRMRPLDYICKGETIRIGESIHSFLLKNGASPSRLSLSKS